MSKGVQKIFFVFFLRLTLLRYNLHSITCIYFMCTSLISFGKCAQPCNQLINTPTQIRNIFTPPKFLTHLHIQSPNPRGIDLGHKLSLIHCCCRLVSSFLELHTQQILLSKVSLSSFTVIHGQLGSKNNK